MTMATSIRTKSLRVIGQCNSADFQDIEHLATALVKPEDLDTSTLKRKQTFAFLFVNEARKLGISFKLLRSVVKEVLFWGYEKNDVKDIEIRFIPDPKKYQAIVEFKELWRRDK